MCYYGWNVTKTRCQKVFIFYWDSLYIAFHVSKCADKFSSCKICFISLISLLKSLERKVFFHLSVSSTVRWGGPVGVEPCKRGRCDDTVIVTQTQNNIAFMQCPCRSEFAVSIACISTCHLIHHQQN